MENGKTIEADELESGKHNPPKSYTKDSPLGEACDAFQPSINL